jgi:hypothetical protein
VGGEGGETNYWVPIYRRDSDHSPALVLWFFDSRGGASLSDDTLPNHVDPSVGKWIEKETAIMNAVWGPAEERSALAFVHIPPYAIRAVQAKLDNSTDLGWNEDDLSGGGAVQDLEDAVFWNALNENVKNLRAVIAGHDHGNEWCSREPEKDVIFCFCKHSGYGGIEKPYWGHGVRNLVFRSADPQEGIETWIRLEDGNTRARVVLDSGYGRTGEDDVEDCSD